ncbi:MAG TPA: cyclic nucleotide-binding domain-containing protein [Polyangiales bacterium]|nr:cyclic nucleotide-binding domain-containing protein [Polyangiales bacterium]
MQSTVLTARLSGEHALTESQFERALALFTIALETQPEHLVLRLRVADSLLALGQVQRAALVYTTLARHASHAGYPLLALVAIKILSTLEPALAPLVRGVADLYANDSGRIGLGVRMLQPSEDVPLVRPLESMQQLSGEALARAAEAVGGDLTRAGQNYPDRLSPLPLLSELSRGDFAAVLQTVTLVRRRAGETVLTQGEAGDSFFMVARGDLEVVRESGGTRTPLATLHEGALFGEMALWNRTPRTAFVRTQSPCDLLEFHVDALGQASRGASTIAKAIDKFTRERLVNNLMATAPLFRPLDRTQQLDLMRRFVGHEMAAGTDLIREGEPGRGLYVLLHGAVDVSKRDGDQKVLLATLGAGDVFGEMSLLQGAPAAATVTASQRSTVLFLAREYVERLTASIPQMREYLETLGDERAMDNRMWLDTAAS